MALPIQIGQTISADEFAKLSGTATPPQSSAPEVGQTISAEEFAAMQAPDPKGPSLLSKAKDFVMKPLAPESMQLPQGGVDDAVIRASMRAADLPHGGKFFSMLPIGVQRAMFGGVAAVNDAVVGMSTPLNIGLLGVTAKLGPESMIGRATSGLFAADMIINSPDQVLALVDAIETKDPAQITRAAGNLALTTMFATAAGKHAMGKTKYQAAARAGRVQEAAGAKASAQAAGDVIKGHEQRVTTEATRLAAAAKQTAKRYKGATPEQAQAAVDRLTGEATRANAAFDALDAVMKRDPSALSEVEKAERAIAIDEGMREIERVNQSPWGAAMLRERLAQEELMARKAKQKADYPGLRGEVDEALPESPMQAEALKRDLAQREATATEPSALSEVEKQGRAAAIEEQLATFERNRQSPVGAEALNMELGAEEYAAVDPRARVIDEQMTALEYLRQSPEGSKLLRDALAEQQGVPPPPEPMAEAAAPTPTAPQAPAPAEPSLAMATTTTPSRNKKPWEMTKSEFIRTNEIRSEDSVTATDVNARSDIISVIGEELAKKAEESGISLPESGGMDLRVAIKDSRTGKIISGKKGDIHASLVNKSSIPPEFIVPGFVDNSRNFIYQNIGSHRQEIVGALQRGNIVPPEVLKDYPDLAAKANPSLAKAATELAKGLRELSGGDRIGLLPYSEANYRAAKPHLEAFWNESKGLGKSYAEFSKDMLLRYGADIRPYLTQLEADAVAKPAGATPQRPQPQQQPRPVEQPKAATPTVPDADLPYNPQEVASIIMERRGSTNQFELNAKADHVRRFLRGEPLDEVRTKEIQNAIEEIAGESVPDVTKASELPPMPDDTPVVQRKLANGMLAPPVPMSDFRTLLDLKDLPLTKGDYKLMPFYRIAKLLGPRAYDRLEFGMKDAEKAANTAFHYEVDAFDAKYKLLKADGGMSRKSMTRIGTYAIAQRANGAAILKAMGKKAPTLTPNELEMYHYIRGKYDQLWNEVNAARVYAGKEPIEKVEDYFTFNRIFSEWEQMNPSLVETPAALWNNFIHPKMTGFQYAKQAKRSLRQVDLDAGRVFKAYLQKAENHIHIGKEIARDRELLKPFRNSRGEVVYSMESSAPNARVKIQEWLDDAAGIRPKSTELSNFSAKVLDKFSSNIARSTLSWNMRSALIQPTSLINSVVDIGVRDMYSGIGGLLSKSKRTEAMRLSSVLQTRKFDMAVDMATATTGGRIDLALRKVADLGFGPLKILDMVSAEATWIGAYKHAQRVEGLRPGRESARYADDVVLRTQGSGMRSDMAPIQRSALGRAATLFQTFVIGNYHFLTKDVAGMGKGHSAPQVAKNISNIARWVGYGLLVDILFEDVLGMKSPMPQPVTAFVKEMNRPGGKLDTASLRAAGEVAEILPIIGGGIRYGKSPLGAVAETLTEISTVAGKTRGPGISPVELGAKVAGIPGTAQVARALRSNKSTKSKGRKR